MRIAVLIDRYWPILGGAQNNVHELCRRLSAQGMSDTVLTRRIYADLPTRGEFQSVAIRRVGYSRSRVLSKVLCFLRLNWWLIRHRGDYDLVLSVPCSEVTDLLPAFFASRLTKKPYVVRMTGFPTFEDPPPRAMRSLADRARDFLVPNSIWITAFRNADLVVAQSTVLQGMASKHGLDTCEIIPNGVDTARFHPAHEEERRRLREELGLPRDKVLLINVGRYDSEKNQITFLKAFRTLESRLRPGKAHALVLGATQRNQMTSNEAELKHFVTENGLADSVTFVDDATDVEKYLKASDVFVQPTTLEGMSNALLEAMATGLAIVCSDIPQNTCVVPERCGLFFSPLDEQTLTDNLLELVDSPQARKELGNVGAAFAAERYSNDKLAAQYAKLLKRIAPDRRLPVEH